MSQTGDRPSGDDLERIIERGLQLYGLGDVDAALAMWEQALALDPDDSRAAAYVDYVRENYDMLAGASRGGDDSVPFGLGSVAGDAGDDYEVEVSGDAAVRQRAAAAPVTPVEQYIESIDEGWFLDEERPARFSLDEPPPAAPGALDPLDLDAEAPSRPSRQLPLPANPAELTLEIEAEEPDPAELSLPPDHPSFDIPVPSDAGGDEEDKTGDFGAGARWARAISSTPLAADFTDQKSALPTQEIAAPRGFVRSRLAPVASAAESAEGLAALEGDEDDDRLRTRPGRATAGPLESTGPGPRGVAPEVLSSLGGEFGGGTASGRGPSLGPEERTREHPQVRVTFAPDPPSGDLLLDEERTMERAAARLDTSSEPTMERGGAGGRYTPAPIDEPGGVDSGRHPPLVIVEDPGLADSGRDKPPAHEAPPDDGSGEYDVNPATSRVRRIGAAVPPVAPTGTSSIDDVGAGLEAALTAAAPPGEAPAERTRRRVSTLVDRAVAASTAGDHPTAVVALDLALREDPDSAVAQKLIHRHQPAILDVYQRYLGDLSARPTLALPMHELADQKLDIRAAFLLSRIDGTLTFEEILDVSGMQRSEAFRHLSMLLLRGILEIK
jgi:hypothetical protein